MDFTGGAKMKKMLRLIFFISLALGLVACGSPEWEKERELGNAAEESGDLNQAMKHYKKSIKLKSNYSEAREDLERTKQKYYEASRERQRKIDEERDIEEQEKNNTEAIIDIKDIIGKAEGDIEVLLGPPSESESGKMSFDGVPTYYKLNYYSGNEINEIGRASCRERV